MARTQGSGAPNTVFVQQADAALSQDNPVSDQLYTVLATTANVSLDSVFAMVTWAITQPTNLRIIITTDGIVVTYLFAAPVTATGYSVLLNRSGAAVAQSLIGIADTSTLLALQHSSGRSVKIQVAITWAVTQPTPLVCRVKYARIP